MSSVLYPGSFDPVTRGHIDVILRLRKIFDCVVVLVAHSTKKQSVFSAEDRVVLIKECLGSQKGVRVITSSKLTVEVAKKEKIFTIARSARTASDWEFEYALADANKKLAPQVETLFLMADPEFGFISSSLVREIAMLGGDTSAFVPDIVKKALQRKFKQKD